MLRPDELREWLRLPFKPFRMYVLERTFFEVRHAELLLLHRSSLDLCFPRADAAGEDETNRRVTISLLHISRIEPIGDGFPAGTSVGGAS